MIKKQTSKNGVKCQEYDQKAKIPKEFPTTINLKASENWVLKNHSEVILFFCVFLKCNAEDFSVVMDRDPN